MQDRVRAFRAFLQDLDSFGRRQYLELDFTATSLVLDLFHHWQRSGPGADHKPPALPGYLLLYRERCMPKPIAEPFGRFFLALADAATVYHDVMWKQVMSKDRFGVAYSFNVKGTFSRIRLSTSEPTGMDLSFSNPNIS